VAGLGPGTSLAGFGATAADAAAEALARTPEQLEVLRRAGVVDAGGRGLVVLLEALVETVTGVRRDPGPTAPPVPLDVDDLDEGGGAYEVMFLLDGEDAAAHALRSRLAELGARSWWAEWDLERPLTPIGAAIEAGSRVPAPHLADWRGWHAPVRTGHWVAVAHGPGPRAAEAAGRCRPRSCA
jgi:hypothetical protein